MMRLLDLHAASCAGDTLITIGLAGTIFFTVPLGEARGRVALYLLVTMVPFALLAPVVGPLLDRFRHGRRYALAATMLGRALLAWMIADNIVGFGLYPAAFGVLALSRAYGVARSAAVPRLLPPGSACPRRARGRRSTARWPARSSRRSGWSRSRSVRSGRCGWPRHLPDRHGDRAEPAAQGRLRPARGGAPAIFRLPLAAPAENGDKVLVRPAGDRHPDRQRRPARAVRLPAAVPGVRDPRGRPDRPRCSAGT